MYTVIIWQDVSASAQTTLEAFKATVKEVVPFSQLALVYIIGTFELGGEIMIRFTSKIEQGIEQGIKQGREETRKIYRAWADWNKRREDAGAKGIPFTDPPPPNPENGTGK